MYVAVLTNISLLLVPSQKLNTAPHSLLKRNSSTACCLLLHQEQASVQLVPFPDSPVRQKLPLFMELEASATTLDTLCKTLYCNCQVLIHCPLYPTPI